MNKNSIIPIIQESERVLAEAIKHFALTVKPEQIYVTVQSKGRKQAVGWFAPERWKKAENNVHEINISAECIQSHDMGELMIHELAHAENNVLGVKDCASNGRLHNKHFKSMAERLGLEVKPRDKSVGYGYTDLAQGAKDFLAKIKFDKAIFNAHRGVAVRAGKVGSRLIKCECANCGYVCRTTKKWLDEVGEPHCPEHGAMVAGE